MTSQEDLKCINTIRFLATDAIDKAKSGHPGAPLGAAPIAYTVWKYFLKHNPSNPAWFNRDRFVLSCGHASMLLYAILHLTGYDISLDDIKNFRQWDSKTPGHPEYGQTPGVEMTTGPLGAGFATAVGMAMAEKHLSAKFNINNYDIIDHHTYVLCSDGDLMEGISSEAASIAGHLGLGKLIYLYDDNNISIEGSTNLTFTEDIRKRFEAYNFQVIGPIDGNDVEEIKKSIEEAQRDTEHPSIIICKTTIGYGSPNKAGKASSHGEPLGIDETILTKKALGWETTDTFVVPEDVREAMDYRVRGEKSEKAWEMLRKIYNAEFPELSKELNRIMSNDIGDGYKAKLEALENKECATRDASGMAINAVADDIPMLMGGSADLSPSCKTNIKSASDFSKENPAGRNIHFGIREHAMGAIANGMALHGGIIPFVSTFMMFYDYMRASVRLSALMKQRVVYVYTHDSIGLGEDGPTHQPIEQLIGMRSVPNLTVIRPCDAAETISAWNYALNNTTGPTALVLSRQKLPPVEHDRKLDLVDKGAYIIKDCDGNPDALIIATGSEVSIALTAQNSLASEGIKARVISMPSWEIFEKQSDAYKEEILPSAIKNRVSIEAGSTIGWHKYVGDKGKSIGIDHFGASAPASVLYKEFGFTAEAVINAVKANL
jgi:transketolase